MVRNKKMRYKGSALMYVIIAAAFIGILATIVLRLSLENIETKSVDRSMKKNFYGAESYMDQVNIAIQDISKDAMKQAYTSVLSNYSSVYGSKGENTAVQSSFANNYINNLVEAFKDSNTSLIGKIDDKDAVLSLSEGARYDVKKITKALENAFKADEESTLVKAVKVDGEPVMELHYYPVTSKQQSYLLLKNVRIDYEEEVRGEKISTTETTDFKLTVPKLNIEGGSVYLDFTKYCLIGDTKVSAEIDAYNAVAMGNVYAGEYGLHVSGGNSKGNTLTIGGSSAHVITRGDIGIARTGALLLGSEDNPVNVWAQNYVLEPNNAATNDEKAILTVHGNSYIHDDLSLNGSYSTASFSDGSYYGYSFNKDNTSDSMTTVNSGYSSAIVINGKNCSLSMDNTMDSILLGGRAFISREREKTLYDNVSGRDIMMPQSVSIKSDQNFMLVDDAYLKDEYKNATGDLVTVSNPMPMEKYRQIGDGDEKKVETRNLLTDNARKNLRKYLDTKNPITTYVYDLSGTNVDSAMVYFYYNFKNQEMANQYFEDKMYVGEMQNKAISSKYLRFGADANGLMISPKLALFSGYAYNLQSKASASDPNRLDKNGDSNVIEPAITDDNENFWKGEAINYAAMYKSYQTCLSDKETSKYSYALNAYEDGDLGFDLQNKDANRIFDRLITKNESGQYKFVEEAAKARVDSSENNGFKRIGSRTSMMAKAVPVKLDEKTTGYVIFVADDTIDYQKKSGDNSETSEGSSTISGDNNQASSSGQRTFEDARGTDGVVVSITVDDIYQEYGISDTTPVLIVSNCNVIVNRNVNGTVLSRYNISLKGTNVNVKADPARLQSMIATQKNNEGTAENPGKFLTYFADFANVNFGAAAEDAVTDVNIAACISYQNWRKNKGKN